MAVHWNVSWHHVMLGIPPLWLRGIAGQGVTVALLDTGLANPRGLDRREFEYLDARGTPLPEPSDGPLAHGTSAGSLIASYQGGALGIAPLSKLVSLRVLGPENTKDDLVAALEYVSRRPDIDVVSCSFVVCHVEQALRERVLQLASAGKLVVAAAGNQDDPMDFPEQTESVLTVAAVDPARRPLQAARRGPWIDVAAPGFDLPVVLPGVGRFGRFGQSSAAAAVVSGVAALVLSTRPAGDKRAALARGLEGLFKATATPLVADKTAVGSGFINPAALAQAAASL